jgi:hypothetical protein
MSFLVTIVVTFVLIPGVRKQGLPTTTFFFLPALILHNANNTMMAIELLISNMQFSFWHFPFCMLFGTLYVIFQWVWVQKIGAFYYFFLDYDRPDALVWHVGLLTGVRLYHLLCINSMIISMCGRLLSSFSWVCGWCGTLHGVATSADW